MSIEPKTRDFTSIDVVRALRRCWQPVARIQDLQHGPQRAVLLGQALVAFLTESGEAAVLADRCIHRGAPLSMGQVCGEAVQCPYHGWEWGRDGACVRIPSLGDQGQIPPRAQIAAYPTRQQWGLVWTVLEDPVAEPPSLPWFDEHDWTTADGQPFELPVAMGLWIENFRDVAHFAFVHRQTLGDVAEIVEPLEVERHGFEVEMQRETLNAPGGDPSWDSLREIRYHAVAPNLISAQLFFADGSRRCMVHVARAISATESFHYWTTGMSEDYEEFGIEEILAAEKRLYDEDREIVSAVTPPELVLDGSEEVNTRADSFTLAYRQTYIDFLELALKGRAQAPAQVS
jgi:phenylpropionate dioxygenase-like ring-hydroxylating dioxygenase large terminal subunit